MSAYRTYIMGNEAAMLFDRDLLANLKSYTTIFWKMSWRYYSDWRVLHIDGFEGCDADGKNPPRMPECSGMCYKFFTYATPPSPTSLT